MEVDALFLLLCTKTLSLATPLLVEAIEEEEEELSPTLKRNRCRRERYARLTIEDKRRRNRGYKASHSWRLLGRLLAPLDVLDVLDVQRCKKPG